MRAVVFLAAVVCAVGPASAGQPTESLQARVARILKQTPLIDGHNDLPWQVRKRVDGDLAKVPLAEGTAKLDPPMHTDIPRLTRGKVGGQFWSVYVPVDLGRDEAVRVTLEQIDVVHRMVARWSKVFELARTAADVERIHRAGRVASLIGMEGGHSIGNSLGALRMMYEAGARYMTLTHWKANDWADAATDEPRHGGLSDFGEAVVREMNRLGMLVDLSHVSFETMRDALRVSEAPVIFSHSGAFAVNPHPRNVPDDVLKVVGRKGGVVMVDFLPMYVSQRVFDWVATARAEKARLETLHVGDAKAAEEAMAAWKKAHPQPRATLAEVADHVDHIKEVAGAGAVGIGSDYDGMSDQPDGLDDVSSYPALLVELARRGYTDAELAGIAGGNVLRVMRRAEAVAKRLRKQRPPSARTWQPDAPGR